MSQRSVRLEEPVSFLSRLRGERPDREPGEEERFTREVAAVARNLRAVLSARKGSGSVIGAFGLGDWEGRINDDGHAQLRVSTSEILAVLVPEMEEQVRRFEPRLEDPRIALVERDRRLAVLFWLRARLAGRPVRFRLALHTVYRGVEVESRPEGDGG